MRAWIDRLRKQKGTHKSVGLCISDSHAAVVYGDQLGKVFEIESIESLVPLLKEWLEKHQLDHCRVNVALGHPDYDLFQMDRPDVTTDQLSSAVHWKLSEYIEYPVIDAVSDVFDIPDSHYGSDKQIYVSVARLERLKAIVNAMMSSGMIIESINIADLAFRNLAELVSKDVSEALGLIAFYKDHSRIYICYGDVFYLSRIIGIGLDRLHADEQEQTELSDQFSRSRRLAIF